MMMNFNLSESYGSQLEPCMGIKQSSATVVVPPIMSAKELQVAQHGRSGIRRARVPS